MTCGRTYASALLLLVAVLAHPVSPQTNPSAEATPEMSRLAQAFAGEWNTTETMERSRYFPNGGQRNGISHWRLAVGGTTIVGEGHSDGSAGSLDHLILIWWDKQAKVYDYFVCFKDEGSLCEIRGTAHWEGNTFVNDYAEIEGGKKIEWRDSFVDITPKSYTLIAARKEGDGSLKTLITTRSVRR